MCAIECDYVHITHDNLPQGGTCMDTYIHFFFPHTASKNGQFYDLVLLGGGSASSGWQRSPCRYWLAWPPHLLGANRQGL